MMKFMKAVMRAPVPVQLWLMLLMAVNLIVPLFFLGRQEAQMTLVVFLVSAAIMIGLHSKIGFTRILGVGHILWFPLLYFLWTRLDGIPGDTPYGIWIRAVMLLNGLSLVIDVIDVIRYAAGDREETIKDS
jgi:hypothetical protein